MATLRVDGGEVSVELSTLEKLGALSRGVSVPVSSVTGVRLTEKPYKELRGLRVGTAIPFVILLGRMVFRGGTDFVAVYGSGRTAIIDLADGAPYKRLFVSGVDALTVEKLRTAARL